MGATALNNPSPTASQRTDPTKSETRLIQKSSPADLAELLDSLAERLPSLQPALNSRHLSGLPLKLLADGLKAHGDEIETERLYDWLSVGSLWDRDAERPPGTGTNRSATIQGTEQQPDELASLAPYRTYRHD